MSSTWQTLTVNQRASAGYGTDYPFRRRNDDVRYALGDLWLGYEDEACAFRPPLRVAWLHGGGVASPAAGSYPAAAHAYDAIVEDADGRVVFDSTQATDYKAGAWGRNLTTVEWARGGNVLRATFRSAPPPWDASVAVAGDVLLADGELDARCYTRLPKRVRSLRVGLQQFTGDVEFVEGFNVRMTTAQPALVDGGRRRAQVSVRSRPGDGIGKVPGCDDVEPVVRRINTVAPSADGDFAVDADGCFRLQRPAAVTATEPRTVALTEPAALQMLNDCAPCCSCDDYVRTYEGIRRLFYEYQALGDRAEATRDQFALNVERWERQDACRKAQTAKLAVSAERDGVLFVGGLSCNATAACAVPVVLRTTFEYFRNGAPLNVTGAVTARCRENRRSGSDTKYDEVPYQPVTRWPVLDHYFDFADAHGTSRFRNRLRFPAADGDTVRVTLSVHVPAIYHEGREVPQPTGVAVPAGVAAIWATVPPPYPVRAITQTVSPVSQTAGCCR